MATYENAQQANRTIRERFDTARAITEGFLRASITMNTMVYIKQGSVGRPEGDSGQIVIKFTTRNGYSCHLTFHTGGKGEESTKGAFHVVIDEKGSEPKRYYRFEPYIDGSHLKLRDIRFKPISPDVFGLAKPLGDHDLDEAMKEVIQAVNSSNIAVGGKPVAHAENKVASIMTQGHIDTIKKKYVEAIPLNLIGKFNKLWENANTKKDLIDYYKDKKDKDDLKNKVTEMLEAAKKGGKRKQTKKRKINRRRNRTRRN
jgi:hypothetical protein